MKKVLLLVFVSVLFSVGLVFAGGSSEGEASETEAPLRVAMELQFPPFETADTEGNPTGISVQIAQELGEYLGREVEIIPTAWTGLIPAVQAGNVDIVISSMSITEERSKTIDFSIPYASWGLYLLAAKDSPIESFNDLNAPGRVVAVKAGTTGESLARRSITEGEIRSFEDVAACVLEVAQGKADAFIYDALTVYESWEQTKDSTRMILDTIEGTKANLGMGIQKGNDELREQVNEFIRMMRAEDRFNEIANPYVGEIKEVFAEYDIPFFFDL